MNFKDIVNDIDSIASLSEGKTMQIDTTNLAIQIRTIRTSLLFDENWYKSIYKIKYLDGATHYCLMGWKAGYDPSPFFSTNKYLEENPDIKNAEVNPLVHWELRGRTEEKRRDFVNMKQLREAHPELLTDMQDGLIRLRVTNACNAKCRYCGVRLFFGKEKHHMMDRDWLFNTCRPLYSKIKFMLLTGGDPNITPHSYEFMKFISEEFPHITIMNETNAIAFDRKFQELAADYLFKVHVSINSSNAQTYQQSCWEGNGGEKVWTKFMIHVIDYVELLAQNNCICFAPDVSMVVNHDNYYDVLDFAKLALEIHATGIGYFFDYTENNMNEMYFSKPEIFRPALRVMMELERVLANKVSVSFRLWVPIKELEMMQPIVDAENIEELYDRYKSLIELAADRSIIGEHKERNRIRKMKGKKPLSFEEDYASTIRMEQHDNKKVCFAPWKELDLYPDGRIDFCGWYDPTLSIIPYINKEKIVDWNEIINSYEYMRGRYKILNRQFDECQTCCPMNDAASPIIDLFQYSCPDYECKLK